MKNLITYFEERRLIARFRQGDRAAFDTLYETYAPRVLAFAVPLVGGCRADAEDLVQETFIAAFQATESFRGTSRLLTWLFGITLRRLRDGKRRQQPVLLSLSEEHEKRSVAFPSVEQTVLSGIRYHQALARLEESQRIAFVLIAAQGLTHKEAAALVEAPIGTIKWRVAQDVKHLRADLSEEENEEEAIPCAPTFKTKI